MVKEIQLTGKRGGTALISDEDYDRVSQYKWYKTDNGYAATWTNGKVILMHCFIMGHEQNYQTVVHHKDHDVLNNQRSNLQIVTHQQNSWDSLKRKDASSKYKGVSKADKRWHMQINNGKTQIRGCYTNEIDAARAYDFYAIKLFGEFARLNFPEFDYTNYKPNPTKPKKTSKYKNICLSRNKWKVRVAVNGKTKHFAQFDTELEALNYYNDVISPMFNKPKQEI